MHLTANNKNQIDSAQILEPKMQLPKTLLVFVVTLSLLNPALANPDAEAPIAWSLSFRDIYSFVANGDPALISTLVGAVSFAGLVGYRIGAAMSPQSRAVVPAAATQSFAAAGPEEISRHAFAAGYAATLGEWQKIVSNIQVEGHTFLGAIQNMTPQEFFKQALSVQVNQIMAFAIAIGVMKKQQALYH